MPFETLNLGLNLTLPTQGTTNWGATLKNTTWTKISSHDHTGSGNGAKLSTAAINDYQITTQKLSKNYGHTQAATVTPAGTSQTLDLNLGNVQKIDLGSASGNVTLTLSNMLAGSEYLILIVQGATPRSLVWPANVKWPQGQEIMLSQTGSMVDYVKGYYDGTNLLVLQWDLNIS